jgi:hypothetical protein
VLQDSPALRVLLEHRDSLDLLDSLAVKVARVRQVL